MRSRNSSRIAESTELMSLRMDASSRIAVRLPQKIRQSDRTRGLDDRGGARDDAGVVAAVDGQRLDLAGAEVERVLRHADGRGGLDAGADDERHAARDAAEHAAVVVSLGLYRAVFLIERVVGMRAAQRREGEACAELHALDRRNAEQDGGQTALHAVEHWAADAGRAGRRPRIR